MNKGKKNKQDKQRVQRKRQIDVSSKVKTKKGVKKNKTMKKDKTINKNLLNNVKEMKRGKARDIIIKSILKGFNVLLDLKQDIELKNYLEKLEVYWLYLNGDHTDNYIDYMKDVDLLNYFKIQEVIDGKESIDNYYDVIKDGVKEGYKKNKKENEGVYMYWWEILFNSYYFKNKMIGHIRGAGYYKFLKRLYKEITSKRQDIENGDYSFIDDLLSWYKEEYLENMKVVFTSNKVSDDIILYGLLMLLYKLVVLGIVLENERLQVKLLGVKKSEVSLVKADGSIKERYIVLSPLSNHENKEDEFWTDQALLIAASKYMRVGEVSIYQLISRVVFTIFWRGLLSKSKYNELIIDDLDYKDLLINNNGDGYLNRVLKEYNKIKEGGDLYLYNESLRFLLEQEGLSDFIKKNHLEGYEYDLGINIIELFLGNGVGLDRKDYNNVKLFYSDIFDLYNLLILQEGAYNSPVWFNFYPSNKEVVGSACFIFGLEDDLTDIRDKFSLEAKVYSHGSGVGINYGKLREDGAELTGGGWASGPLSFMEVSDSIGAVVKSGGRNRRAAKMNLLDVDHPDIEKFIEAKHKEEEKAHALIEWDMERGGEKGWGEGWLDAEAYKTVKFQNSNFSVGITDDFMEAVDGDKEFNLKTRHKKGGVVKTIKARDLMRDIAYSAWKCGDPGLLFLDRVNKDNVLVDIERVRSSNPCGEFTFVDDSACNLASLRLTKYLMVKEDGRLSFNIYRFKNNIDVLIRTMDYIVDVTRYPYPRMRIKSILFRPLGLGYTDLGALLIKLRLKYGEEDSLLLTSFLTAYLTLVSFYKSNEIAINDGGIKDVLKVVEELKQLKGNKKISLPLYLEKLIENKDKVVGRIKGLINKYIEDINIDIEAYYNGLAMGGKELVASEDLIRGLVGNYKGKQLLGDNIIGYFNNEEVYNIRNLAVTLLAPTGTISFLMDADSTGIEPILSAISWKTLVGGGVLVLIPKVVKDAISDWLREEGRYNEFEVFMDRIKEEGTIRGIGLSKELEEVLKGALDGLGWENHISMQIAAQRYLTLAISKTINLPEDITVEDIEAIYMRAWKEGLKGITIFRNGSKMFMPVKVKDDRGKGENKVQDRGEGGNDGEGDDKDKRREGAKDSIIDGDIINILENEGVSGDNIKRYLKGDLSFEDALNTVKEDVNRFQQTSADDEECEVDNVVEEVLESAGRERLENDYIVPYPLKEEMRKQLPDTRASLTHKFVIGDEKGYLTVGFYDDGNIGEVFVRMNKEGTIVSGLMDVIGTLISIAIQYGVPIDVMARKMRFRRFDPMGYTENEEIRQASSPIDYIFRYLELLQGKGHKVTYDRYYKKFGDNVYILSEEIEKIDWEANDNFQVGMRIKKNLELDNNVDNNDGINVYNKGSDNINKDGSNTDKDGDNIDDGIVENMSGLEVKKIDDVGNIGSINRDDLDYIICSFCGARAYKAGTCYLCTNCGETSGCS